MRSMPCTYIYFNAMDPEPSIYQQYLISEPRASLVILHARYANTSICISNFSRKLSLDEQTRLRVHWFVNTKHQLEYQNSYK